MSDLLFLIELRENIDKGLRDIARHEMALKQVDDWIDELKEQSPALDAAAKGAEMIYEYINLENIKKEYDILTRRIIYRRAMKKESFTVSHMSIIKGNSAYTIKVEFHEYAPELAQRLSDLMVEFVDGLRFLVSKAYGGKHQGITYYLKPNWEWWFEQGKEKELLEQQ